MENIIKSIIAENKEIQALFEKGSKANCPKVLIIVNSEITRIMKSFDAFANKIVSTRDEKDGFCGKVLLQMSETICENLKQ
jgi:hypothetical protein